eukprot:3743029-Lingulodinium_polyedra.AAC.1
MAYCELCLVYATQRHVQPPSHMMRFASAAWAPEPVAVPVATPDAFAVLAAGGWVSRVGAKH